MKSVNNGKTYQCKSVSAKRLKMFSTTSVLEEFPPTSKNTTISHMTFCVILILPFVKILSFTVFTMADSIASACM